MNSCWHLFPTFVMPGCDHLRTVFGQQMGLSDQDIVALSGGHTLVIWFTTVNLRCSFYNIYSIFSSIWQGRCHKERSGFEGAWTSNPLIFDNSYFKSVVSFQFLLIFIFFVFSFRLLVLLYFDSKFYLLFYIVPPKKKCLTYVSVTGNYWVGRRLTFYSCHQTRPFWLILCSVHLLINMLLYAILNLTWNIILCFIFCVTGSFFQWHL